MGCLGGVECTSPRVMGRDCSTVRGVLLTTTWCGLKHSVNCIISFCQKDSSVFLLKTVGYRTIVTPNMHIYCHLVLCFHDFGPLYNIVFCLSVCLFAFTFFALKIEITPISGSTAVLCEKKILNVSDCRLEPSLHST